MARSFHVWSDRERHLVDVAIRMVNKSGSNADPDEMRGRGPNDDVDSIERSLRHLTGTENSPVRTFDLLILDYGGVCTLSHAEFLDHIGSDTSGDRPGSLAAIARAHAAGITVVVLSNEIDQSWITNSAVLSQVDHVLACADNGIFKPDRRAFQRAALVTGCAADRTLVVDDEIDNVRGAQAAGMTALLFDTANPEDSWESVDVALRGA
jgi:putative hydrolase of the HAD superfamily